MLPEYRLTFGHGGAVNAIKQRGYEVYGVLFGFDTQQDWEHFQQFDAGYHLEEVLVYPLMDPSDNPTENEPMRAYTSVYNREYSDSCDKHKDKNMSNALEQFPQERYLQLIASGMRAYDIDEEYIEDHILSIPYTPKTKPEHFKTFPQRKAVLPKMEWRRYYDRLCRNAAAGEIYFVIGNKIIAVDSRQNPANPCIEWMQNRMHGFPDSTLMLHRTVVDPDLPMVDDPKQITPLHTAWAENHLIEWMNRGGLHGTAVFQLVHDKGTTRSVVDTSSLATTTTASTSTTTTIKPSTTLACRIRLSFRFSKNLESKKSLRCDAKELVPTTTTTKTTKSTTTTRPLLRRGPASDSALLCSCPRVKRYNDGWCGRASTGNTSEGSDGRGSCRFFGFSRKRGKGHAVVSTNAAIRSRNARFTQCVHTEIDTTLVEDPSSNLMVVSSTTSN